MSDDDNGRCMSALMGVIYFFLLLIAMTFNTVMILNQLRVVTSGQIQVQCK